MFQKTSGNKKKFGLRGVWKFLSHSAKIFRVGTLQCVRSFRVSNNFMHRKWIAPFANENFLSQSAQKICGRTLQCFKKFPLSENLMDKKGIALNCAENSLSHIPGKVRSGTFLCFRKIGVSKTFMHRRRYHFFRWKFFLSQCRIISWGNLLCFKNFGYR